MSCIYRPDFIVCVEDGHGEDAKDKKLTMETYWVPGINRTGQFGRWAFVEFTEVFAMNADLASLIQSGFHKMLETVIQPQPTLT